MTGKGSGKPGRPSNKTLVEAGQMIVSKTCKICQSSVRDQITQAILQGIPSSKIIAEHTGQFESPLTPTNIHSHKQHVSPEAAVKSDRKKAMEVVGGYDKSTKDLYSHRYDELFDKQKAADALYKQRLENLFQLQREIAFINEQELQETILDEGSKALRRKLISDLEIAYKGFSQDLIKHIQLDSDLYMKQASLQLIEALKTSYLSFTQKLMDVMVKEIDDNAVRGRLVEQLADLLDREVSPVLNMGDNITAEYEEIA